MLLLVNYIAVDYESKPSTVMVMILTHLSVDVGRNAEWQRTVHLIAQKSNLWMIGPFHNNWLSRELFERPRCIKMIILVNLIVQQMNMEWSPFQINSFTMVELAFSELHSHCREEWQNYRGAANVLFSFFESYDYDRRQCFQSRIESVDSANL